VGFPASFYLNTLRILSALNNHHEKLVPSGGSPDTESAGIAVVVVMRSNVARGYLGNARLHLAEFLALRGGFLAPPGGSVCGRI
jgi:hypothetical protein